MMKLESWKVRLEEEMLSRLGRRVEERRRMTTTLTMLRARESSSRHAERQLQENLAAKIVKHMLLQATLFSATGATIAKWDVEDGTHIEDQQKITVSILD